LVDQILQAYPDKVNFVAKQFPLSFHQNADPAARAALAAGKQGKYWEMYEALYKSYTDLSAANIKKMATEIGLDVAKFEQDMNSEEVKKQVAEETQLGQRVGVRGTPTFFVNGRRVVNRSLDAFKQMIDEELKKKGKG